MTKTSTRMSGKKLVLELYLVIKGVTSWNNSNKEGRIHFVGKMTPVSNPGPSWASCNSLSSSSGYFLESGDCLWVKKYTYMQKCKYLKH